MLLTILKSAVPIPKLESFNTYLFVGPHPDDIEVACGGTVAKLVRQGKKVVFLVATNGCVGSVDKSLTSSQLIDIRREESLKSAQMLGVSDVRFLPYNDGDDYDKKQMLQSFVQTILDVQPQVVLCPDYTCPSECHPDHLNVGKIATDAVFHAGWEKLTERLNLQGTATGITLAYYYTHEPNRYVNVTKTHKLHLQAIACHQSQFTQDDLKAFQKYFALREIRLGMRKGMGRAEGYRVLAPTHQHCFPEASEF